METEQPVARRCRGFSTKEKDIIVNVYRYVQNSSEDDVSMKECSERTSEITGLDQRQIYRLAKERRLHRRQTVTEMVNEETLTAIRRKIYCFFHEAGHGVPRPENILREVNQDERLPSFAMPAFRRILTHLQYCHIVTQNKYDITRRCETFSIPVV